MALFQKKPQTTFAPLYTHGLNRTVIIAGLGNIGKEYKGTRHNIGFHVVESLAEKQEFDPWIEKKDLKAHMTSKMLGSTRVILIKPTTYMNHSGEAVRAVTHFYKVDMEHVIVVHDEIDVHFGQIRTRMGGGSAGHNGIKSVTQVLGEHYGRVRIGIKAHTKLETEDFVLAKFTKEEQEHMPALTKEALAILTEYVYGDSLPHETRNFII